MSAILLVLGVVIIISACLLLIYFTRRPSRLEIQAVYEISQQVSRTANSALTVLHQMRREYLPGHLQQTSAAIDDCIQAHHQQLERRTEDVIDGEFFMKAAKAALPREAWKEEFEKFVDNPDRNLLDTTALEADLEETANKAREAFQIELVSELSKTGDDALQLSDEGATGLARLKSNPKRFQSVIGPSNELEGVFLSNALQDRTIVDPTKDLMKATFLDMPRGLSAGLGLFAAGSSLSSLSAGLNIIETFDPHAATEISKDLVSHLGDGVFGAQLLQPLREEIVQWIVQEVGEEAFREFTELALAAVGAAVSGIGLVLVAWKMYSYSRLFKRLFIDKEPLQNMREGVKERSFQPLQNAGAMVKVRYEDQVLAWLAQSEAQLKTIQAAATEREGWALQYL